MMLVCHRPYRLAASIVLLAAVLAGPGSVLAAEETVIPTETCKGLWIIPISYGGDPDRTLRFLFDTGASYTSVDPDAVERLTGRRVRENKWVRLRDGEAGPMKFKKIKAKIHEMDATARALGTSLDGILGFPTFKSLLLTLDYPAGEIRVSKGSLPEIDDEEVFRDFGKVRPYLALDVGDTRIPVLVDSGFTGALTLRASDPLEWASEPRAVSTAVRHNGIRINRAGRLAVDLAYGPLVLERPIVDIIESGTRLSGEDLLRRFIWTFDQNERRIRMIAPSTDPIRHDPVRGTGLGLRPTDVGFEIVYLFPDSPAEEADLMKGDVIVATDGIPVFERGCDSTNDDAEKESLILSIVRGGETMDVVVRPSVLVP